MSFEKESSESQKSPVNEKSQELPYSKEFEKIIIDFIITGSNNDQINKNTNAGIEHHKTR